MKMVNKNALWALALCAASLPGAGQAQQFYCTLQSNTGIIPPEVLIDYGGATATVTHAWIDQPSVRQVQVRGNGARRNLNYVISNVAGFGAQRATLRFSFRHNTSTNAIRLTINPVEYNNQFAASGSCSQVQ